MGAMHHSFAVPDPPRLPCTDDNDHYCTFSFPSDHDIH